MRLIRQIVKKKFVKHLENIANRRNNYWDFFMAYNMVAVMKGIRIENSVKDSLNINWRHSLVSDKPEKYLGVMENFAQSNSFLATNFLRDTESMEEQEMKYAGMYEKGKGIVGVLSFHYDYG